MSPEKSSKPHVRPATITDLPAIGRLGALLVTMHHQLDSRRFLAPSKRTPENYAAFLGRQIDDPDGAIFVAEESRIMIGYAYATVEGVDYKALRGPAGVLQDIIVDPDHRGRGLGRLLLDSVLAYLKSRGVPQVVLATAAGNESAQRLFASMGFRRTMVEMARQLDEPQSRDID